MRGQLRIVYPVTLAIFAVLFVSCPQGTRAQTEFFIDIYPSTLFSVNPPIDCGQSQTGSPGIFNLETRNPDEIAEAILAPDSPLHRISGHGLSDVIEHLEKDLASVDSLNDPNLRQRRLDSDINAIDIIRFASKTLFGDSGNMFLNEVGSKDSCKAEDKTCDVFNRPTKQDRYKNSALIYLCILLEVVETGDNIGSIACRCVKKYPSPSGVCEFVSKLSTALGCNQWVKCPATMPKPFVPKEDPRYVNLPMYGTLPTPQQIPQSLIDAEMPTYYLLQKSVALLTYDAMQASCDPKYKNVSLLSGWGLQMSAYLVEKKTDHIQERVPIARIANRPYYTNPLLFDFLISVRDPLTPGEWGLDFSYNQVLSNLTLLDSIPLHRGISSLASAIWGQFQIQINSFFDYGYLGLITITGQGLGGAVAHVLGHLASKHYPATLPHSSIPRIRVVSFGALRAGGPLLWADNDKTINQRRIESTFDAVPQFFCDGMRGCPATAVPVPTARDVSSSFPYSVGLGFVPVTALDLPPDFSSGKFPSIRVSAWHYCAYDCWTSRRADPGHLSSCDSPKPFSPNYTNNVCPFLPPK